MGKTYNIYSFVEAEIQQFLTAIHNAGHIDAEGFIKKSKLRRILRAKVSSKKLTGLLNPEKLGELLNEHGYLLNTPIELGMYKIKMEKILHKTETKGIEDLSNIKASQSADKIVSFKHRKTCKRDISGTVSNWIKQGMAVCLLCSQVLKEIMSDHIQSHIVGRSLTLPKEDSLKKMEALFEISHHIDPSCKKVKVLIKNIYMMGLQINQIQLVHEELEKISILKHKWPHNLGIWEQLEVTLEPEYFLKPGQHFYFIIHADRKLVKDNEYLEFHRLTINKVLHEAIRTTRREKISKAELAFTSQRYKFRKLNEFAPDLGLLKLFDENFTIKTSIEDLTKTEVVRYNKLVKFNEHQNQLNPVNYTEILCLLVEIEDLFLHCVFRKYKIPKMLLEKPWGRVCINVEDVDDLPESIQEGDTISLSRISPYSGESGDEVDMAIWKIADSRIFFDYDKQKNLSVFGQYQVRFKKDRTVTRMEHDALDCLEDSTVEHVLFPTTFGSNISSGSEYNFNWFNPCVAKNCEQQQAVENIVKSTAYPAPYIVFGPPGTGKTSTIVEAIAQIWKLKPTSNILVTAPSNFACDEIATRLLAYVPADEMYRYYSTAAQKRLNEISDELILISNLTTGVCTYPPVQVLKAFRIVLTTVVTAGKLSQNGLEKTHFEYIFIDECGSSTEPSAIIPIAGLSSLAAKTNIVIAGDPKQLGPIVMCDFANIVGLGKSMLERLMDMELYKPGSSGRYNEKVITKLLQNFRTHESILKVPSELFYNDELIPKAKAEITDFALDWDLLPNKMIPIIFHSIKGSTRSNANSFSIYNGSEINQVISYVKEIANNGINGKAVPLNEIGIVSPYRLQCAKIQKSLKFHKFTDIEVGSAEQFQGKEKMVIILSTVRSFTKTAGFLGNPKRLNVVITRAKGLLIIIGNPHTLQLDLNWFKLLHYCKENKTVIGEKFKLRMPTAAQVDCNGNEIQLYEKKVLESINGLEEPFSKMMNLFEDTCGEEEKTVE